MPAPTTATAVFLRASLLLLLHLLLAAAPDADAAAAARSAGASAGGPPPPAPTYAVRAAGAFQRFDGIGAISGGGGETVLLPNYPDAQQAEILDYLFKPGFGAALHILKVEIGGDALSTDGAEPSHMHTETEAPNFQRGVSGPRRGPAAPSRSPPAAIQEGASRARARRHRATLTRRAGLATQYEFWLAKQAKQRNEHTLLYGLPWEWPAWVGAGTGNPFDNISRTVM